MTGPLPQKMNLTIFKTFSFEASHVLPKHPGHCSRLHGHSWKLTVGVSGPVDPETGFVVDYGLLSETVKAHVIMRVDHQHLGCGSFLSINSGWKARAAFGEDFYPSSENLVVAFARLLQPLIQELRQDAPIDLEEVSLEETCTCKATWRRQRDA